ncbi:MAG: ABC transporter ATP-binding protein [SAR202 cluster bacterium]|jgi:oligopeptide/dipeptide ABC transporter ATP-binding protein|nr:MAG: ABC transporter ATP-binding protein [SAR202 cluster bacterium]KAA1305928.1 MAG: ABC transporter ATP-binding protein [SAR202 cluster bacterium]MCH2530923.1 ABC transporter ATP-binding protein [Dehalococcoidia bacterium]MQG90715.1 ABC transporter ATP-binding protein [SAR202 cluster bacterium]
MTEALLSVENLHTQFRTEGGLVQAVDDVSFNIQAGETFALVGESGCGKSVTALSIMGLIPNPPGEITSGSIQFGGVDLLKLSSTEMRSIRGSKIGMIFQEPMSSLNPVLTIESQLAEPLKIHTGLSASAANDRAQELIDMVGIPDSKTRLKQYPHELSGGQRQRIMIAMAMACAPRLLIADEATTALDVTIQAQILDLMQEVTEKSGAALLIITHNLGIVARYADRVAVMYAGKLREVGDASDIYAASQHPYTVGLLRSVPRLDSEKGTPLSPIGGEIPDLTNLPGGCAFNPRCQWAVDRCSVEEPELIEISQGKQVACFEHASVSLNV